MSYYNNFMEDPVLLKLSSGTATALVKSDYLCLEDLFGREEHHLLEIAGVGKKRVDEILELLNSLSFDYLSESLPSNLEQDPMLGVDSVLAGKMNSSSFYYGDKNWTRGLDYYRGGRVTSISPVDELAKAWEVIVSGTYPYRVRISLDENEKGGLFQNDSCTCPAHYGWAHGPTCKHQHAAMLALANVQRLQRFNSLKGTNHRYHQLVRSLKSIPSSQSSVQSQVEPDSSRPLEYLLVKNSGQWKLYPKQIYPLLNKNVHSYIYGRYGRINPWDELTPVDPIDRMAISYLKGNYHQDPFNDNGSVISNSSIGDVLDLLKERSVYIKQDKREAALVHVEKEAFDLLVDLNLPGNQREADTQREAQTQDEDTARTEDLPDNPANEDHQEDETELEFRVLLQNKDQERPLEKVEIISADPCWILFDGTLARLNKTGFASNIVLNPSFSSLQIPVNEIESFMQEIYPVLQSEDIGFRIADELTREKKAKPEPRVYLSENARQLNVEFRVAYEQFELKSSSDRLDLLLPASGNGENSGPLLWKVRRDIEQEEQWLDRLQTSDLERIDGTRSFTPLESPREWVIEMLPELAGEGFEIYGEADLKRYARPKKMTSSTFSVKNSENWFELEGEMRFGDISLSMKDIRNVLVKDKPWVKLQDNTTGELPERWLRQLNKLLLLMDSDTEKTRVPKIAAPVIKELGETADSFERGADFDHYAKRLRSFEKIEQIDPPDHFMGELRDYQVAGLSWMAFLRKFGLNGILADDMGLGKTVQVLALLRKVAETSGKRQKVLILAPRSVINNWRSETEKFVPDFETYLHHGPERITDSDLWPDVDLCISTYATVRNDIEFLQEIHFDYAILDESHAIRNATGKTFRALKKIQASNRLCITGTPVQNTTMDLWSQFQFLNPGLLGNQKEFKNRWVKPIEQNGDSTAEKMLHRMVVPFILRRTKSQVASDLPPLTTVRVDCDMPADQQKVYEKYRQSYHQLIHKSLDEQGLQKSRFTVLEGLTRLRQISCSPTLIEGETGKSAKILRFVELAEELISEGHRALVFSQFVGFLKEIEAEVRQRGWDYEYLDGQTGNRQERVDRFQEDSSKKLFLISLKAGGEGLNLTSADYVFIMDPWWNPAAERQAMDRTHRIGQKEQVFVYRFVSPGTVEEKIVRLQERKKDLAEKMVVAESGMFKDLQRDELLALFE